MKRKLTGNQCLCRTCGEYFKSGAGFQKHRVGVFTNQPPDYGRRCLTPAEMYAAGMAKSARDWWITAPSTFTGTPRNGDREKSVRESVETPARLLGDHAKPSREN